MPLRVSGNPTNIVTQDGRSKTSTHLSTNIYLAVDNNNGPLIVIMAGTHGNEPTGTHAIYDLIEALNTNKIKLKKGKLILIPEVNYCALKVGIRFIPFIGDINRKYPHDINKLYNNKLYNKCPIIDKVTNLIKDAHFVLDFHDGWGFHRINNNSMGSTISPTDTKLSYEIANLFKTKINDTISDKKKHFNIFTNDTQLLSNEYYSKENNIKGSLRYYMNVTKQNYILIETSGQNNIQPLEIRKKQCNMFINELFSYYNFI